MRAFLTSLISVLVSFASFGQQSVAGHLVRDKAGACYLKADSSRVFKLVPQSEAVRKHLGKLKNMDLVQGTGQFDQEGSFNLLSVDFVGLKRLLGPWAGSKTFLNFKNFKQVRLNSNNSKSELNGDLEYAITPASGEHWKIFFTDSDHVVLASLQVLADNRVTIIFFDADTGIPTETLFLNKVR